MSTYIDTGIELIRLDHISLIGKVNPYNYEPPTTEYNVTMLGGAMVTIYEERLPRADLIKALEDLPHNIIIKVEDNGD